MYSRVLLLVSNDLENTTASVIIESYVNICLAYDYLHDKISVEAMQNLTYIPSEPEKGSNF